MHSREPDAHDGPGAATAFPRTTAHGAAGVTGEATDAPLGVAEQLAAQRRALEERLASVGQVVAVMSGKGGVGKSAVAANLAAAWASGGYRVGALDADLAGQSLATMLGVRGQRLRVAGDGIRPAHGVADVQVMSMDLFMGSDLDPLEWRHGGGLAADTHVWRGLVEANALREMATDTVWGALDVLVVDLPPGSDRFEVVARLLPRIDAVVAVTLPAGVAVRVVRRAVHGVVRAGQPLAALVVNMDGTSCPHCGVPSPLFPGAAAGPSAAIALADELDIALRASIPFDPEMAAAADRGIPIVLGSPDRPAAAALCALAEAVYTPVAIATAVAQ